MEFDFQIQREEKDISIYDFKQTIGKTYNGKPTSRLKVVVIDGKVKTCYPY